MTIMDPKAAAEAIRGEWKKDPPPEPSAEGRHSLTFLQQVCDHLGVEQNETNAAHVAHLMAKAGIEQHRPDEYPKMLTVQIKRGPDTKGGTVAVVWPDGHDRAGEPVIFHSAEEEDEFNAKYDVTENGVHEKAAPVVEEHHDLDPPTDVQPVPKGK